MDRKVFKLSISDTLNRALLITAYPKKVPLQFSVLFNKKTSALESQYDTRHELISSGEIKVSLHRNLSTCPFCNIFFNLENAEDSERNYRSKFLNVKTEYKDVILQFFAEKLDLRTGTEYRVKDNSNYLTISGWQLYDYGEDILFFFVQRKIFNVIQRTSIIRTMGIQFNTIQGFEVLKKYEDYTNNSNNEESDEVELPDYLKESNQEENIENKIFHKEKEDW